MEKFRAEEEQRRRKKELEEEATAQALREQLAREEEENAKRMWARGIPSIHHPPFVSFLFARLPQGGSRRLH